MTQTSFTECILKWDFTLLIPILTEKEKPAFTLGGPRQINRSESSHWPHTSSSSDNVESPNRVTVRHACPLHSNPSRWIYYTNYIQTIHIQYLKIQTDPANQVDLVPFCPHTPPPLLPSSLSPEHEENEYTDPNTHHKQNNNNNKKRHFISPDFFTYLKHLKMRITEAKLQGNRKKMNSQIHYSSETKQQ